jgi:tRNA1Val (adenine37-N6)-methyltransferase
MMAQRLPLAMIDAIEIEESAFQQSKENFSASPWSDRLNALQGDARNYRFPGKYDLIISNPPFYEREWSSDDPGRKLAHHESGLLLGELLRVIRENLSADGSFYLLLPFKRKDEIRKLLTNEELKISSLIFVKQTPKHDYFRILMEGKPGMANEEMSFDEMTIKDENDEYSSEFVSLLKDYYLYL